MTHKCVCGHSITDHKIEVQMGDKPAKCFISDCLCEYFDREPLVRPYNERRNKNLWHLVERRKIPQKEAAAKLGITWSNLRMILYRKRHVTKCNKSSLAENEKVA